MRRYSAAPATGTSLLAAVSRNEPHEVTRPQPLQTIASDVGVASMTALQIPALTATIGQKKSVGARAESGQPRRF